MLKYSVGIDVSASTLACCMSTIDDQQRVRVLATCNVSNSTDGFKTLMRWIKSHHKADHHPLVCVLEATGVYYENCALALTKAGLYVSVVLPNKSKKYMESLGLKSKNDKIDARGLARMAAEQALPRWKVINEFFFTLRTMTRQLESLQKTKTSISNQLHATQNSIYQVAVVTKQLKSLIKTLEKQQANLQKAITNHIHSDADMAEKVANLCSIKGVGLITAAVLLGETNGFALMQNTSQLVSYCGYDVVEDQSGKRVGKTRISKKGNSRIRRALYFPAITAVSCNVKPLSDLFDRTHRVHHIKMKSYVAVQKKLLILIYTLGKKNEPFIDRHMGLEHTEGEEIQLANGPYKQERFPANGREPQGKHPFEWAVSF